MTIARILKEKGRDVLTTPPHRTMREAAEQLGSRRVGAVVVADAAGKVLGILSERDIVRAIGQGGAEALSDPVSLHMTARVSTIGEVASIDEVMRTMTDGRFRHVPVVENDRLVGIVSIGDIVKRHVDALNTEREALREYIATA